MSHPTLDHLPDLTLTARQQAVSATFAAYSANGSGIDNAINVLRFDDFASLSDLYRVTLTQGASYFFYSSSFFDPFVLTLYDEDGNAVAVGADGTYGVDTLSYTAPYTGAYYFDAAWDQGSASAHKAVTLIVFENFPTGSPLSVNDNLAGSRLFGGIGNDSLTGTAGEDYLRGDEGDDVIAGGDGFDDMHGNAGNDSLSGGNGNDWVVGGKDNDTLKGEQGDDLVYGNLGNDTLEGGAGNDLVRGGQGADVLVGGSGDDWLSGDRDNDTLTGESGADTFNFFAGAGQDRVTDFRHIEGDRVKIEPGSSYTVNQVGADTVINMADGSRLLLAGVQLSTLPEGWIFVA
jgi:Ca2+-binding RTX toxin-like protein